MIRYLHIVDGDSYGDERKNDWHSRQNCHSIKTIVVKSISEVDYARKEPKSDENEDCVVSTRVHLDIGSLPVSVVHRHNSN